MKRLLPYPARVNLRRCARWLADLPVRWRLTRARAADPELFPHCISRHSSKLLRRVKPEWAALQQNKVANLRLACARMNRLVVAPGQLFSFCAVTGPTGGSRGYLPGLEMHQGRLRSMPGGGLCQLSNLIFWLALNAGLEIVERHRHEQDLFPDDERTVPFGMGATVFYNYLDLRFRNTLGQPLLIRVAVDEPDLCGAFYAAEATGRTVEIVESAHRFFRDEAGRIWRENRVAVNVTYPGGTPPARSTVYENKGLVRYDVPESSIEGSPA